MISFISMVGGATNFMHFSYTPPNYYSRGLIVKLLSWTFYVSHWDFLWKMVRIKSGEELWGFGLFYLSSIIFFNFGDTELIEYCGFFGVGWFSPNRFVCIIYHLGLERDFS